MAHSHATSQTPDDLLQELEALGEEAVRQKLERGHFASFKVSLIEGWLRQLEEARQRVIDEKAEAEKRDEDRRANRVLIHSREGRSTAENARMFAMAATILASIALVLSILALLGLGR